MKILFISMHSVHAIRWIENLKDTPFELFWYDIMHHGNIDTINSVVQFTNTKKRKFPYIKGEYFISKRLPKLYDKVRPFLEITENEELETIIRKINPDIIHSFEMQSCSYPILKTMEKFSKIKWIYSCWGNDIYYFKNFKEHNKRIRIVLKRIDYLHTDCERDLLLAEELGFKGEYVGLIPGGTGYKIDELEKFKLPIEKRKIILVKGYEHIFGRGLNIIKALKNLDFQIENYDVVIFGAHKIIFNYVEEHNLNYKLYTRHGLSQQELLKLMGTSLIYIGNSISDGIPNTLLEALVMGAFPIQSNPGGVTSEVISHQTNGLLINDPENVIAISQLIREALKNKELIFRSKLINDQIAKSKLGYKTNQRKILDLYEKIKSQLSVAT